MLRLCKRESVVPLFHDHGLHCHKGAETKSMRFAHRGDSRRDTTFLGSIIDYSTVVKVFGSRRPRERFGVSKIII